MDSNTPISKIWRRRGIVWGGINCPKGLINLITSSEGLRKPSLSGDLFYGRGVMENAKIFISTIF
jgi:hypothetical protein